MTLTDVEIDVWAQIEASCPGHALWDPACTAPGYRAVCRFCGGQPTFKRRHVVNCMLRGPRHA